MMYGIIFSSRAQKSFDQLTSEDQERIIEVLERVRDRPHMFARQLKGSSLYKLRVGKNRIIFDINETEKRLEVHKVGDRKNIYKRQ